MNDRRSDALWQGVLTGLVGYATVALLAGLLDVTRGHSFFFTASLLGEHFFYGLTDPSQVTVWPGAVFAYNGLHLVTFLFVGLVAAWLALMSEKGPEYWYVGIVMFLLIVLHAFGAMLLITEDMRAVEPVWAIVLPTLVAWAAMAVYLLRMRPALRQRMLHWEEE